MALFSLSIGGVLSAQEQDVPEEIVETPVTDNQDDSFGDGDYVNMDGCEGTVYLTPEAAMEAAIAAGMNLDDPGNIPFPYHDIFLKMAQRTTCLMVDNLFFSNKNSCY